MINIYKKCRIIKYGDFPISLFIKLLCFKIELKFISLKIERIGFFNTLLIAVWINPDYAIGKFQSKQTYYKI